MMTMVDASKVPPNAEWLEIYGYKEDEYRKAMMAPKQPLSHEEWVKVYDSLQKLLAVVYVDKDKNVVIEADDPAVKADLSKELNNDSAISWRWHTTFDTPAGKGYRTYGKSQKPGDRLFLHALADSWALWADMQPGGYKVHAEIEGTSPETEEYILKKALKGIFEEDEKKS